MLKLTNQRHRLTYPEQCSRDVRRCLLLPSSALAAYWWHNRDGSPWLYSPRVSKTRTMFHQKKTSNNPNSTIKLSPQSLRRSDWWRLYTWLKGYRNAGEEERRNVTRAEAPLHRHSRLRAVTYTSAPVNLNDATGDEMPLALTNCQYQEWPRRNCCLSQSIPTFLECLQQ